MWDDDGNREMDWKMQSQKPMDEERGNYCDICRLGYLAIVHPTAVPQTIEFNYSHRRKKLSFLERSFPSNACVCLATHRIWQRPGQTAAEVILPFWQVLETQVGLPTPHQVDKKSQL